MLTPNHTMKRALVAGALFLVASAGVATAGPYGGLAIGTNGFSDDQSTFSTDGRAGRVFGGYRFALPVVAFSAEAGLEGYSLYNAHSSNHGYSGTEWFLAGKVSLPLTDGFEVFGRVGVEKTSVSGDIDLSGSGYLIGAGAEYRFNLSGVNASVFVDLTRNAQTLDGGNRPDDSSVNRWMLGVTVGM